MCASPPKPKPVKEKPVQWLRNPLLDGLKIGANTGRSSLRTDLGSSGAAYVSPYDKAGTQTPTTPTPTDGPRLPGNGMVAPALGMRLGINRSK